MTRAIVKFYLIWMEKKRNPNISRNLKTFRSIGLTFIAVIIPFSYIFSFLLIDLHRSDKKDNEHIMVNHESINTK